MESVYLNGGMVGATLDFASTDQYTLPAAGITYVGGSTDSIGAQPTNWSSTVTVNLPAGTQVGDLCIVAITCDFLATAINSVTGGFTNIAEQRDASTGMYYGVWVAESLTVSSSIDVTFTRAYAISICTSVYRDANYVSITTSTGTSGMPDSPSVTANTGEYVVITGHLDDDNVTMTAPSGYTLSSAKVGDASSSICSTAIAYKEISSTGSEDPAAFGGAGDDEWRASSIVLALGPGSLGNFKNSGIWALSSVYDKLYDELTWNYETPFSTPTYTITTIPSQASGVSGGTNDVLIAIDANIGATDTGLLMELGGAVVGLAIGVVNGTLRFRCYDGSTAWTSIDTTLTAKLELDISSYTGTLCTYYFAEDYSAKTVYAYVQVGGKGSTNRLTYLGSATASAITTQSVYGGAARGYGQVGTDAALPDLEASYEGNFSGTIDEIRYWAEDAGFDVAEFGASVYAPPVSSNATSTFIGSYGINASQTTYNFTIASISAGLVVVAVHSEENQATSNPSTGVTIGGVTATLAVAAGGDSAGGTSAVASELWYAVIGSSTTSVDVTFDAGNGPLRCGIGVYTIADYTSVTPSFTGTDANSSFNQVESVTTSSVSGAIIAIATSGDTAIPHTWTGATENYDEQIGGTGLSSQTGASLSNTTIQAYTITVTRDTTPTQGTNMAVAVWS